MIGPLLDFLDACLAFLLGDTARVVCWAAAAGAGSMGLYALASPQRRLTALAEESAEARRALSRYDGDFSGALPLIRRSLSAATRRVGLVLGPSTLAGLPVLVVLFWIEDRYGYAAPRPGESVAVGVLPRTAAVSWQPSDAATASSEGRWLLRWPETTGSVRLLASGGVELLKVPAAPVPAVGRWNWLDAVLGSRAGALAAESPVEAVHLGVSRREFVPIGPPWARTSLALFLGVACAASLAVKRLFRLA
ncbi:MAG TPA: hypothetical protein VF170_05755 [Planctomycetaceae bacterium]